MIRASIDGDLGVIVLARPERRNALTPDMLGEIRVQATRLGAACRAILVYGDGPAFCAGFDLDLCRDDPTGGALSNLLEGLWTTVQSLRAQPLPVVFAIHGAAIAGGCALLGGADIVIADQATKLGYPVARLGISPGVSSPFLASDLPSGAVRELQLDPGILTADRARKLGLVSKIAQGVDATIARGRAMAGELSAKPPEAIRATRSLLQELSGPGLDAQRRGLDCSLGLVGGDEVARMLPAAWAGKRS